MIKPCNLRHCSGHTYCIMCAKEWDYGDFKEEECPNIGRKVLDVAFEKLLPYLNELNKKKKLIIDIDELLKGTKK